MLKSRPPGDDWNENDNLTHESDSPVPLAMSVVENYLAAVERERAFLHMSGCAAPAIATIVEFIEVGRRVLFPGYFSTTGVRHEYLRQSITSDLERLNDLVTRLVTSALCHEGLYTEKAAERIVHAFLDKLPGLKLRIDADVLAAFDDDPAAKGYDEIILSYPGLFALMTYRLAHELHILGLPLVPRMMTEYAHSRTGIDIHPGARIGDRFFIDHGTGVVIGETTEIGERVRVYQGVTLGALSLPPNAGHRYRHTKRHPTIEDDVIIYANTTILGGDTVIGARSTIGGNNWITESVPPDTKVLLKRPEKTFSPLFPEPTKERTYEQRTD